MGQTTAASTGATVLAVLAVLYLSFNLVAWYSYWQLRSALRENHSRMPIVEDPSWRGAWWTLLTLSPQGLLETLWQRRLYRTHFSQPPYFAQYKKSV